MILSGRYGDLYRRPGDWCRIRERGSVKCRLRTIVFRVRKQWDYCCHVLICMVKTIVCSLRFTLTDSGDSQIIRESWHVCLNTGGPDVVYVK